MTYDGGIAELEDQRWFCKQFRNLYVGDRLIF